MSDLKHMRSRFGLPDKPSEMTPLEALIILKSYKDVCYKSKAGKHVVANAHKILDEEATRLMQRECSELCISCWGDGFNRIGEINLEGPCTACNGSGRRS